MKRWILLSLVLLVATIIALPRLWLGQGPHLPGKDLALRPPPSSPTSPDPRLAADAPRNARPDAKTVGDMTCAICHEEISKRYQGHAMANTLAPASIPDANETLPKNKNGTFQAQGMSFKMRRDGNLLWHSESLEREGKCLAIDEAPVALAMGSGRRGRSYLIEKDNRFFQSPISWFSTKQIWDISPGFGKDRHFSRSVNAQCLYCHAGESATIDSNNRFQALTTNAMGISCERCHGPGEDHANFWFENAGPPSEKRGNADSTIVQPARLAAGPRDSVCNQCHLQGAIRVERRGREQREYRPGLELEDFWTVFLKHPAVADKFKAVGQVEQMRSSKCFQKNSATMGCITCHDPHGEPALDHRDTFYRQKCAGCHGIGKQAGNCTAPMAERLTKGNACAQCHMPRSGASDIVHASLTDHRLTRRPDQAPPSQARPLRPDEIPFVRFMETKRATITDQERDLGIALVRQALNQPPQVASILRKLANPMLKRSLEEWPDDSPALLEIGRSLRETDLPSSIAYLQKLRLLMPKNEEAMFELASSLSFAGNKQDAEAVARILIEKDPVSTESHDLLTAVLLDRADWPALETCTRLWLERHPLSMTARLRLTESLIFLKKRTEARQQLDLVLEQDPASRQERLLWYHRLLRESDK